MTTAKAPFIHLYPSLKEYSLSDPQPDQITLEDIAHALSRICRFTGSCSTHYSVAQHCVMGALLLPPRIQPAFLLHDASECPLGDVNSPLKSMLPEYRELETMHLNMILAKYGMLARFYDYQTEIHEMDLRMLASENRIFRGPNPPTISVVEGLEPAYLTIIPWTAEYAKRRFLELAEAFGISDD